MGLKQYTILNYFTLYIKKIQANKDMSHEIENFHIVCFRTLC